ncbi:MAG: damage-inducible protein DinB [Rhodospirillales bacterium]|nr:damage-inducible protein DinB [Rhodospirillales bacterium]
MTTPDHFRALAAYNEWANSRLYEAAGRLDEESYLQDRAAFFGSIHGTLNHILVGDRIWLGRLTGEESGIRSLDQILHTAFDNLWEARQLEDRRIIGFVDGLKADRLGEILKYRNTAGEPMALPIDMILTHLFNHDTHHRGQAHNMLSQAGADPQGMDLAYFLQI